MLSDIEIAQNAEMYPIGKIAAELSIAEEDIEYHGHYKAKLSEQLFQKLDSKPNGKLILVTAINPTPAGEGKTTVSVGLADALHQIGKKNSSGTAGTVFGTGVRHQGRSSRRRLCTGSSHGGHQPALHR